ncbi:Zn-ribbon domain-containing OB-fold protein [Pseudochelatococcus sp. B33]
MTEAPSVERHEETARSARPKRPDPEGIVFVDANWDVPQFYRPDPMIARMFESFREKRLLGARVADGSRVIFPPQSYCEITFKPTDRLVDVGPGGIIRTLTISNTRWSGPPPPYLIVFVQLDGASTATGGYLRNADISPENCLALIGARCRVIFKNEPVGDWSDIWFELAE